MQNPLGSRLLVIATIALVLAATVAPASADELAGGAHTIALFGTKTLLAGVVVLVLVAGGAVYWFTQRDK